MWFNGWRCVFPVFEVEGRSVRSDAGVWVQRVRCAECRGSWPIRDPDYTPHCSFSDASVEATALAYLADPAATYRAVARRAKSSPAMVWRWITWIARLGEPGAVISRAARIDADTPAPFVVPAAVPADHIKARSAARAATLLLAFQLLVAFFGWRRTQTLPPDDPSPLSVWLRTHRRPGVRVLRVMNPAFSPPKQHPVPPPPE